MAVDEAKLNEFLGKAVGDLGAAMSATLMLVGDRLGLYRELAKGAVTPGELAQRTGTNERYVREWLGNQAAGGYVQFDPASDEWSLSPEQALCLTDPNGPVDMPGAYNIVEATFHALEHTLDNFKSGEGMEWGEHHPCLFEGTERFFRAGYNTSLIGSWLPALDGVVLDRLRLHRPGQCPGGGVQRHPVQRGRHLHYARAGGSVHGRLRQGRAWRGRHPLHRSHRPAAAAALHPRPPVAAPDHALHRPAQAPLEGREAAILGRHQQREPAHDAVGVPRHEVDAQPRFAQQREERLVDVPGAPRAGIDAQHRDEGP